MSEPLIPKGVMDHRLSRRRFLQTAATLSVASSWRPAGAAPADAPGAALVDTNFYLGRWPFRRVTLEDPPALVAKLRTQGVTEAWAGSLDALLYKDIPSVNTRLADECRRHGAGLLVPIAAVNPKLSGWEDELRRCVEIHHTPGIRLHPNYHGYTLADPLAERVLARAASLGLLVQIAVTMEEERTIHPLVNVAPVDVTPLPQLMAKIPRLRVQLLNALRAVRTPQVISLSARGVVFEHAMLEGLEGVGALLRHLPANRLCFGSYAPVFYFDAALLKLRESILNPAQISALRCDTARGLIPRL